MAALDDAIDQLYGGPLDAFTEARNQLAKTARQPDLKKLEKPSLPAWVVNQLFWHHRPVLARVEQAATALLEQHQLLLTGKPAAIPKAEQTQREAVREALATAKEVLRAGGHPDSPATLDAIRNTLQALPSPEAQGRLTRPLAPRGLEALAGLVLTARPSAAAAGARDEAAAAPRGDDDSATTRRKEAARFTAKADAERARKAAQEEAKRRAEEARAEREREARRAAAEAAVAEAEARVAAAEQHVATARAAVTAADRAFADAMAARDAAKAALADARKAAAERA